MLMIDASLTGWGAILEGRSSQGLWKDHNLSWLINHLETLAVFLELKNFLADLRGPPCARPLRQHIGGLLHKSLGGFAVMSTLQTCVPNPSVVPREVVFFSNSLHPGVPQYMGRHPVETGAESRGMEVVEMIWREFGQAQVYLFASRETSHCPLWFSLMHPAHLGLDAMMHTWPRFRLYAFPPIALLPWVLERVRRDRVLLLLIALRWPGRLWFPDIISLLDGSPLELPVRRDLLSQAGGSIFHPQPELWASPRRGPSS